MMTTIPFTEHLSETWLLERTSHACLRNGSELSVSSFTEAMRQLIDCSVPLSSQSCKSKLAEKGLLKKSNNFSVPLSTWREILPEEAPPLFHQGIPILLYGEHTWKHPGTWRPRKVLPGCACVQPAVVSGTEYAVCYLDLQRGTFSNASWRAWFSVEPDPVALLDGNAHSTITFLRPCIQFPYTTHYTVIAADGQIQEYADRTSAIQGFRLFPSQEVGKESDQHLVFPQFCYYHEVTCSDGVYRLEFFGPHMDKQGYQVEERAES